MSTLSEQERHGLEDVFLSISSSHPSILKDKAFHYHTHLMFHLKGQIRTLMSHSFVQKKLISTLKTTFLQKNPQKTEKTRKI